jgi:septal ring factor EnvC (AmiA/AmiB activator)
MHHPFTRFLLCCLGLCLAAQLLPSGVSAQTEQIEQLRADRDAVREDLTRAAADLDPLLASNEKIEESVRLLNEDLAARMAELETTRSQLEQARIEVLTAQDEVAQEQQKIAALRLQLQQQAITAYVQPSGTSDEVLSADDINEGERRRALVSAVQTSQADILDELRVAEANREFAVTRAENAQRQIESREVLAQQQVAEVDAAIADQQRLQAILDARIAEFQEEVDLLASDEAALQAEISGLIIEEERRQEAIREAARIQAERERVAREEEARRLAREAALARGEDPDPQPAVSRADAALVSAPPSSSSLAWPVAGTVTSRFGPRWGRQHNGIDIAANTGTTVASAGPGTVIAAGFSGGFGQRVLVQHGGGLVTLYAHLSSINVSQGQSVSTGSSIGAVGCSGSCTGPHLHFETRVNGTAYDPYSYLG